MGTRQLVSLAAAAALLFSASGCALFQPSVSERLSHAQDGMGSINPRIKSVQGVGTVEFTASVEELQAASISRERTTSKLSLWVSCGGLEDAKLYIDDVLSGEVSCGLFEDDTDLPDNVVAGGTGGAIGVTSGKKYSLAETHSVRVVAAPDADILATLSLPSIDE